MPSLVSDVGLRSAAHEPGDRAAARELVRQYNRLADWVETERFHRQGGFYLTGGLLG